MAYVVSKALSGRTVKVYRESEYPVPVIFSTQYQEQGKTVLELLANLGAPEVNLVTISDLHWEEDLSPWAHGSVLASTDHFTGGAPQYLEFLEKEVIPFAAPSPRSLHADSRGLLNVRPSLRLFALHDRRLPVPRFCLRFSLVPGVPPVREGAGNQGIAEGGVSVAW